MTYAVAVTFSILLGLTALRGGRMLLGDPEPSGLRSDASAAGIAELERPRVSSLEGDTARASGAFAH